MNIFTTHTKCVSAMTSVIHKKRVDNNGNECDVENDDIAQFIFEYKNKRQLLALLAGKSPSGQGSMNY